MKKYLILAMVLLSVLATGCSAETSTQNTSQTQDNTQASENNTQASENKLGTRKNPAKINDVVNFKQDSFLYGNADLELSLLNVVRGEDALNHIKNANLFNIDPEDGKEYAILKFKISNVKNLSKEDESVEVNSAQFKIADANFALTDQFNFITLSDGEDLTAQLFEGGSKEGSVVFQVNPNEPFYAVYEDTIWFIADSDISNGEDSAIHKEEIISKNIGDADSDISNDENVAIDKKEIISKDIVGTDYDVLEYIWPDDKYITYSDLNNYSKDEVALIRNEIYARHGYIFNTQKYIDYFYNKSWYIPDENFSYDNLSDIEKENIDTITQYEKDNGWK